jgi:hypothetical protein
MLKPTMLLLSVGLNFCPKEKANFLVPAHLRLSLYTTDCGLLSELASAPSDTAKN